MAAARFYLTTPIYYVNGDPHIGHVYTSVIADAIARSHRIAGDDVLFITGTDEHATKVVDSAVERGLTVEVWAQRNADTFRAAMQRYGVETDDFIRTSEDRHKRFVEQAIRDMLASGDIYLGTYEGWYDATQEEYVPESRAAENGYRSAVTGKPLIKQTEQNYFFRLSAYGEAIQRILEQTPERVLPAARRNEALGRIREGLNDVPVSRRSTSHWGVRFPDTEDHLVYVWVDALLSYTSALGEQRRGYWPAQLHLIGKEILWFHAVLWPAMLLALQKHPHNAWLKVAEGVYSHSFWIASGQKMSKSLGNVIDLATLEGIAATLGLDALRYFLITQGPTGTIDADFNPDRVPEVYNADLANALGNCWNRIVHMTQRYLGGKLMQRSEGGPLRERVEALLGAPLDSSALPLRLSDVELGLRIIAEIDRHIEATQPFRLAKDPAQTDAVARILYECAESFRIATLWLWPALPGKIEEVWRRMGQDYGAQLADRGRGDRATWSRWGGLPEGCALQAGAALFPRAE
jgi:methionyl-tRNA synthetase